MPFSISKHQSEPTVLVEIISYRVQDDVDQRITAHYELRVVKEGPPETFGYYTDEILPLNLGARYWYEDGLLRLAK